MEALPEPVQVSLVGDEEERGRALGDLRPDPFEVVLGDARPGRRLGQGADARAEGLGATCYGGWLQRPERMVLVIAGMMLGRPVLVIVVAVLAVATWATTVQRIVTVCRDLEGGGRA